MCCQSRKIAISPSAGFLSPLCLASGIPGDEQHVSHACRDVALLLDENWGAPGLPADEAGPSGLHQRSNKGPSSSGTS